VIPPSSQLVGRADDPSISLRVSGGRQNVALSNSTLTVLFAATWGVVPIAAFPQPPCASQPTGHVNVYIKYWPQFQIFPTQQMAVTTYISLRFQGDLKLRLQLIIHTPSCLLLLGGWVWPLAKLHCTLFFSTMTDPTCFI